MTILLVDDDPADAALVRAILTRQDPDLAIISAERCEEALHIAETTQLDCIIMDERLKGVPGSECIKRLREQKYRGAFGLMTGFPDTKMAVDAMIHGADFYISKNDIQDGLVPAMQQAIARRQDAIRAQQAADAKDKQYQEELRHLRDELDTSDPWLEAQRDIKNLTKSLAEVSTKVASIEGQTVQQFLMLTKMNKDWQDVLMKFHQGQVSLAKEKWKRRGEVLLRIVVAIETVALAYFAYLEVIAKK